MFSRRRMPPENCFTGSRGAIGQAGAFERPVHLLRQFRAREPVQAAETLQVLACGEQRIDRQLLRDDAEHAWRAPGDDRLIENTDLRRRA